MNEHLERMTSGRIPGVINHEDMSVGQRSHSLIYFKDTQSLEGLGKQTKILSQYSLQAEI